MSLTGFSLFSAHCAVDVTPDAAAKSYEHPKETLLNFMQISRRIHGTAMSLQTKHIYEFGPFRLDEAEHLLLRDGEAVPLTPKAFDLLIALVERHGRLLEKDELLRKVWPSTFVEEANLASNISLLRKALGDGENGQRYIETAPKRGYRFVADVREVSESDGNLAEDASLTGNGAGMGTVRATASEGHRPSKIKVGKKRLIAAAAMLLVAVVGLVYLFLLIRHRLQSGQPPLRSFSQFTYGDGLQSEPTWSPDGRSIAYSSDRNGNFDIWVQQVGGGDPVQVTKSPEHDWQPDWSPDGKSIIFRSERDGGGLFLVPAFGGIERKVISFGYYPRWSPDNSRILFFGSPNRIGKKVYVVALDGEAPQGVQSDFLNGFLFGGVRGVAWHPDGKRISVWGDHGKLGLGFWTMALTGGAVDKSEMSADVETQFKDAAVSLEKFQWAISGRHLYFEGVSKRV